MNAAGDEPRGDPARDATAGEGVLVAEPSVQLDGVSKDFGSGPVVDGVSLRVDPGVPLALIGPSGCGKSTLLRMMLGLIEPTEGRVTLLGRRLRPGDGGRDLRRRVGLVIQSGGLFPHRTARANAALPGTLDGWASGRLDRRIDELTELVGLDRTTLARYPSELSGGQRQRVALMRALFLSPDVLLLDEPLGALDPMIRASLQADLASIFDSTNAAVVLVTHDLHEAAALCSEIALMRDGRVVQRGTIERLRDEPVDPFVTRFLTAQRREPVS